MNQQGINSIVEMVHHTRLDCALGSAGGMRRAVAVATHHAACKAELAWPSSLSWAMYLQILC